MRVGHAGQGRRKKLIAADGRLLWLLRLSITWGRPVAELEELLTARDLALYQALVETDGPWWGEGQAAYLRQICSSHAAAAGADIPADRFTIDWRVGGRGDDAGCNLLPPGDGLAILAARLGADVAGDPP